VYVQIVDGPGFIRFDTRVGKRTNLHCTSVGKILLAYGTPMQRRELFANTTFARYTRKTLTTVSELKVELEKVKSRGFALDDQEEELEVRCLAVPVFTPKGELLAALSVTGTVGQLVDQVLPRTVELLQRAATRICNYAGTHVEAEMEKPSD
jgi:DNA-binding IclR family transcriptional regulator